MGVEMNFGCWWNERVMEIGHFRAQGRYRERFTVRHNNYSVLYLAFLFLSFFVLVLWPSLLQAGYDVAAFSAFILSLVMEQVKG